MLQKQSNSHVTQTFLNESQKVLGTLCFLKTRNLGTYRQRIDNSSDEKLVTNIVKMTTNNLVLVTVIRYCARTSPNQWEIRNPKLCTHIPRGVG